VAQRSEVFVVSGEPFTTGLEKTIERVRETSKAVGGLSQR
jgi:hypothetical protein